MKIESQPTNDYQYENLIKKTGFKYLDNIEEVKAGCPNEGNPCYCTGACQRIIGYRKKNINPIFKTKEEVK